MEQDNRLTKSAASTTSAPWVTERTFARERRHSRNVRRLKFVLPAAAILLTVGLVGHSIISPMLNGPIDLAGATIEGGKLVMSNPTVGGLTAEERPYEMTAQRAIQDITDSTRVDLEEITARLPVGMSEWADVSASRGIMDRERNVLQITSPALVRTTDGLTARFLSAELDMDAGGLSSNETVEVDFDGSQVKAESLQVTNGGSVLVFEKDVKVTIQARQIRTAAVAEGGGNAGN